MIARKWDYSERRKATGRPAISLEVADLAVKFANENPSWGYDRIAGALANLGHRISDSSVVNVLRANGIEPAPDRPGTSWKTFLKAHWKTLAATDFTNVEVWASRGQVTISLLFVMELETRKVHFAGCVTTGDGGESMKQMAKNLTDCEDGFLLGKTHLIMDRDTRFSEAFRRILTDEGVESVRLPPRSPNMNACLLYTSPSPRD